jgi:3'(2'), 5'-bisphosphate nucleotidase
MLYLPGITQFGLKNKNMKQTFDFPDIDRLLWSAIQASIHAGVAIMAVYNSTYSVEFKSDNSPLTLADKNAHNIIVEGLRFTKIPLLSEEGEKISFNTRKSLRLLWIVDPLDGTKEFVKHNDEFTVNVALIYENQPILGVVYCPPNKTLYFANSKINGAYKTVLIDGLPTNLYELIAISKKLPLTGASSTFTVVASRTHLNEETAGFIVGLKKNHDQILQISKGSSLKFCLVAEGIADIYPRFAPTCEWDTAAAQAIVEFSGGEVVNPTTNSPLSYNKENLLNPSFIVRRKT